MTQLEISIPYKNIKKSHYFALLFAWGVFGVCLVKLLTLMGAPVEQIIHDGFFAKIFEAFALVFSAAAYAYFPFKVTLNYAQGSQISANKDGLGIPSSFGVGSRWLPWYQLKTADIEKDILRLDFEKQGTSLIDLASMTKENIDQLLLALDVWAQSAATTTALREFRDERENKNLGLDEHNYTKMWEEELSRRFNSTTFVPLEPGHKLRSNSIKISKQLAFGGFSAVYLATDEHGNNIVVKESVTGSGADSRAGEFFKREAELLCRLRHPQIATVLDNFVEDSRHYLILEYVPGETLREVVKRTGPQSESTVLQWMTELLDVLEYLHSQTPALIHRDFTPDNIIVNKQNHLTVIDFGAANEFVGSATGTLVGKQSYMPPEQFRGKATPASDIYVFK